MKKIILLALILLTQSCSWFESDYDKLMNPIKKIKLAEKESGKSNPVFDGVMEPDFPNEKENDKTLEGVDSNHDGVRDDIEIWINRTAEDRYVRWALKDYYKKFFDLHKGVSNKIQEPIVRETLDKLGMSGMCLITMLIPYDKKYLEKEKENAGLFFKEKIKQLFKSSKSRSSASDELDRFQFQGTIGESEASYCRSYLGPHYDYILNKYQEHRK